MFMHVLQVSSCTYYVRRYFCGMFMHILQVLTLPFESDEFYQCLLHVFTRVHAGGREGGIVSYLEHY